MPVHAHCHGSPFSPGEDLLCERHDASFMDKPKRRGLYYSRSRQRFAVL
jgi:hypothetical protein